MTGVEVITLSVIITGFILGLSTGRAWNLAVPGLVWGIVFVGESEGWWSIGLFSDEPIGGLIILGTISTLAAAVGLFFHRVLFRRA